MVSQETVLVVGAGGSMPFKFPSGRQLVGEIVENLRFGRIGDRAEPLTGLARQVLDAGCDGEVCRAFCTQLNNSQCYSVDAFLEMHSEYREVGKIAIAAALLPKENLEALFEQKDTWYRYLSNRLGENISRGLSSSLTILTYNYDRSLEFYLYNTLKTARSLSDHQMKELISRLRVIHLHGSLGRLPWQELSEAGSVRDYGNHASARTAAREIKIIHENVDDSPEYEVARRLLGQAKRVGFMGFGFHRTNLRRLRVQDWIYPIAGSNLLATCYGLKRGEQKEAALAFDGLIKMHDLDCLEFLKENLGVIS